MKLGFIGFSYLLGKPLVVTINKREKSAFVLYETCDDAHKAIGQFNLIT